MSAFESSGPAVILGAGSVGCGVGVQLMREAGLPVVVVSGTEGSARLLRSGGVRVRYAGASGRPETVVRPHDALAVSDGAAVRRYLHHASIVMIATRAVDHVSLAPLLAAGLADRPTPVNVLVCDNRETAAQQLRAMVAEHGDHDVLRHGYVGTLVDRIVNRRAGPDGTRVLVTESQGTIHLDAHALVAPVHTKGQLHLVENFRAHVMRKLYVFSAGHAAAAYLGMLRKHSRLHHALGDPAVDLVVRAAMREGQAGLSACFGERFAGGEAAVDAGVRRFADATLDDSVERVGRDPARKLGAHDRICGPARLAVAAGESVPALALVAAAALRAAAGERGIREQLARDGGPGTLARCGQLSPLHPFMTAVAEAAQLLEGTGSLEHSYAAMLRGVHGSSAMPRDLGAAG